MPALSNYAESGILNWLLRGNSNNFLRPNVIAVALLRNPPAETDNGANMPEIANANGYARVSLGAPADATWSDITQDASSSGNISNLSLISFPTATGGDWGWASGLAIVTSGVYGTGQILFGGALPSPREIKQNDQYTLPISNLTILLG